MTFKLTLKEKTKHKFWNGKEAFMPASISPSLLEMLALFIFFKIAQKKKKKTKLYNL